MILHSLTYLVTLVRDLMEVSGVHKITLVTKVETSPWGVTQLWMNEPTNE
jgi:hypothetical protein